MAAGALAVALVTGCGVDRPWQDASKTLYACGEGGTCEGGKTCCSGVCVPPGQLENAGGCESWTLQAAGAGVPLDVAWLHPDGGDPAHPDGAGDGYGSAGGDTTGSGGGDVQDAQEGDLKADTAGEVGNDAGGDATGDLDVGDLATLELDGGDGATDDLATDGNALDVEPGAGVGSDGDASADGESGADLDIGPVDLCVGVTCDDGNACTDDGCVPASGCAHTANTAPCEDGDACTTGDICSGGACSGAGKLDCDDQNPCTNDLCAKDLGCVHTAKDGACEDGNACTVGDTCKASACVPGASQCQCDKDADCVPYDDGDPCTGLVRCDKGKLPYACAVDLATVVTCDSGGDTACLKNLCAPKTGLCEPTQVAEGNACDDGDACTTGDVCASGACKGAGKAECDDKNPCTDDACDKGKGCAHLDNTAPCNDANACTTGEVCGGGMCKGGGPLGCDDGNPCTDDGCDAVTGCVHLSNAATATCYDGPGGTTGKGTCHGGTKHAYPVREQRTVPSYGRPAVPGCCHVPSRTAAQVGASHVVTRPSPRFADALFNIRIGMERRYATEVRSARVSAR